MHFNPFEQRPVMLEQTFMDWKTMNPAPYDKNTVDPYTKARILLMNSVEFEAQWFSRNFSRHCPDNELRRELAILRRIEQQQQKRISILKPADESILEHTIGYEQLCVDLTAVMAQSERNCHVKNAMDLALLEDFDHLYRFSNLLNLDYSEDAKNLTKEYTEIMPGRPAVSQHRHPSDSIFNDIPSKYSSPATKLHINTLTAVKQQVMNYYMNIAPFYCSSDIGRRLYQEIAMIEESHVSQYESLKNTRSTWLEELLLHEYTECYLYYSCMNCECDPQIRNIWEQCLTQEIAHLHKACELLYKYEHREWRQIIPQGAFPDTLILSPNIDYIRKTLETASGNTQKRSSVISVNELCRGDEFFLYQQLINHNICDVASHRIIHRHICAKGQDYRCQKAPIPVDPLSDRTYDNVSFARIPCETPEQYSTERKTADCPQNYQK